MTPLMTAVDSCGFHPTRPLLESGYRDTVPEFRERRHRLLLPFVGADMKLMLAGILVYGAMGTGAFLKTFDQCQAAMERRSQGVVMYCPSTPCSATDECTQNPCGGDPIAFWCACGCGGQVQGPCSAVWTKEADGTLEDFECQNIGCALPDTCDKQPLPVILGQKVFACKCE